MKCTLGDSCVRVTSETKDRTETTDLVDLDAGGTEQLIRDRLEWRWSLVAFVILIFFVILGIVCHAFNCSLWGAVEINLEALKLRLMQVSLSWQVCVVYIAVIIALVVLMGLHYWFELRMVREHRLSQKMKYDFISQKVEGFQDLLKGSPQKDGTHRYEIRIGKTQDLLHTA